MFTWICPQCGREVPPSYSDCPDCTAKAQAPPAGPPPAAPPPQMQQPVQPQAPPPAPGQYAQPVYQQPPPQYYQQPPAGYPPPPPGYYAPHLQRRRHHTWLVTLGVAFGLTALGAAVYYFLPSTRAQRALQQPETAMETPVSASPAASARLAKNLEITGLRIVEEKKKAVLKFLVVNHSGAEVAELKGSITLHASNAAPGSDPISVVKLDVSSIGPNESKEVSTPIKTSLRAYELPDWQFLRADLQVTSQ